MHYSLRHLPVEMQIYLQHLEQIDIYRIIGDTEFKWDVSK